MASTKHTNYVSEHTKFIKELKEQRPHLEAQQQTNRASMWGDEPVPLDALPKNTGVTDNNKST